MTGGEKPRILLIEDEWSHQELLRFITEKAGYTVAPASTGAAAWEEMTSQRPDLVILDMRLPDMDGIDLVERMRERPELADVPIIAVSAMAQQWDIDRAREAGVHHYITKPYMPEELLDTIEEVIAGAPS